jgi:hypothetical protein
MISSAFEYMTKGKVLYPLCGRDYMWNRCTVMGSEEIVFGDTEREYLAEMKKRMKHDGIEGECVRMDFNHPPFVKGAFETLIFKPGYGMSEVILPAMPKISEIGPKRIVAVRSMSSLVGMNDPPVTRRHIEELEKIGYSLTDCFQVEKEEPLQDWDFHPKFAMILDKKNY